MSIGPLWARSPGWFRSGATSTSGPTRRTPTGWPTPVLAGGYRGLPADAPLVGGPEEVAAEILRLGEVGYTDVIIRHLADDHGEVLRSFERLAEVRELVNRA